MTLIRHAALCAGALSLALIGTTARAADPLTDAMQQAYAPYRAALFRTNSGAQAESAAAVAKAREAWQALDARFAAQPPAPYDRDPALKDSLAAVGKVYERAAAQVDAKQLPEAHETLEAARDLMAELRRRNGVVVYSDHMNAYHAQMEHVLESGPKLLAAPDGLLPLAGEAGALGYLAQRLSTEAPSTQRANAEFGPLLQGVLDAVARLQEALRAQDREAAKAALGQLKKPYSQLFLKFG